MMTNLFSMFDPSSSIMSMNWLAMPMVCLLATWLLWNVSNPYSKVLQKIIASMKKEMSFNLMNKHKGTELIIMSTFVMIIASNLIALYPQVFSTTSHLTFTLPMSLTTWLSLYMFAWTKNTNHMFSHLLPQGTPVPLMTFMVMIELTSNIMRPLTLCVRLTANLIAGHLLMALLGAALTNLNFLTQTLIISIPLILTVLESAVACIQAYVFMTLITLYVSETS